MGRGLCVPQGVCDAAQFAPALQGVVTAKLCILAIGVLLRPLDANAQTADSISSSLIRSSGRVSAKAARQALGGSCGLSPLPFRDATPGRQPLIMPGSTDAALAVKTERLKSSLD
jgi:hypothetical protein